LTWVKLLILFLDGRGLFTGLTTTINDSRPIHLDLHQKIKLTYRFENKRFFVKQNPNSAIVELAAESRKPALRCSGPVRRYGPTATPVMQKDNRVSDCM
jgi:hypothetical protein